MKVSEVRQTIEKKIAPIAKRVFDFYQGEGVKTTFEEVEIELTWNFFKSVSNYLNDSDEIEIRRFDFRQGSFEVSAIVTRDGVSYLFETTSIFASGCVQCLHIRYIVKSDLRKNCSALAIFEAMKDEKKKRDALERAEDEVVRYKAWLKREKKSLADNRKITRKSILENNLKEYSYHADNWASRGGEEAWKAFHEDTATRCFQVIKEKIERDKRSIKSIAKDLQKRIEKRDALK